MYFLSYDYSYFSIEIVKHLNILRPLIFLLYGYVLIYKFLINYLLWELGWLLFVHVTNTSGKVLLSPTPLCLYFLVLRSKRSQKHPLVSSCIIES